MNMEYIYLLFVILLYFPHILTDKLGSRGTEEKAMLFKYSFFRAIIGVAVGAVVLIITGNKIQLDLYTVLTATMFGVMSGLCMPVTFYAMQVTTVAVTSVFKAASVIIPCIFGALFFDEAMSFVNVIGFALFLFAVYLIVSKSQESKVGFGAKALLACLGVILTNGFGSIAMQLFGKCVPDGDEAVFMFIGYVVQALVLFIIHLFYSAKNSTQKAGPISRKMMIYGIIGMVAMFLIQQIMTALSSGIPASLLFPVTMGSSVIVSVIVGWLWFKEKMTAKNIIGIVLGIVSLVMINLF